MSYDISTLDDRAVFDTWQQPEPQARAQASQRIRKLFMVLQGAYGNLFLSKFNTGELNGDGSDKGMRTALLVWDGALAQFTDDVIEAAALRIQRDNPDYAPNLPQFERLCEALAPRKTYDEQEGLPRLPPPPAVESPRAAGVFQKSQAPKPVPRLAPLTKVSGA